MEEKATSKKSVRARADAVKPFRRKNLIAVIENPSDVKNIGTVIRNVNALGVEKVYVVDPRGALPDDWQQLREDKAVSKTSVSAVKWTFVRRFESTDACFDYLEMKRFRSIVTSPHVKGKASIFLHEGDYTIHAKLAVWFGSEAIGISDRAVERSEMCVSIPMFGMIESLNLGTSSGIVLYEVAKQRRDYQSQYRWRNRRGRAGRPRIGSLSASSSGARLCSAAVRTYDLRRPLRRSQHPEGHPCSHTSWSAPTIWSGPSGSTTPCSGRSTCRRAWSMITGGRSG